MRTQKRSNTESPTFTVPVKSSPRVLCAVAQSWGQGPAAWGTRSTEVQEEAHGAQLVPWAPQTNTNSQSRVLRGLEEAGCRRGFGWVWSSSAYGSGFKTWHWCEILASDGGNLVNRPGYPWTH